MKQTKARKLVKLSFMFGQVMNLKKIKGFSGHFWAGVSWEGKTRLFSYEKKLDSKDYCLVLENYLRPVAERFYPTKSSKLAREWYLCHDGDGAHRSKEPQDYLETHMIREYDLPAWSPDMTIIEWCWHILWPCVAKRLPSTNEELVRIAKEEWDLIPQEQIQKSILKLAEDYKFIIENNGDYYRHGKNK